MSVYRSYQRPRPGDAEYVSDQPSGAPGRPGRRQLGGDERKEEEQAFAGFFEREAQRRARRRSRRLIIILSVAIHVVVFGVLLLLSSWDVGELFSGSVPVRVVSSPEAATGERGAPKPPVARTNVERFTGLRLVVRPGVPTPVVEGGTIDPPEGQVLDPAQQAYLEALARQIADAGGGYPDAARPLGLRATVTVRLAVARDGSLSSVAVKKPCPHPLLCDAALAGAKAAAPFAAHDGSAGDPWHISVPLRFQP